MYYARVSRVGLASCILSIAFGTRPGSSRTDDSGFRCVNAEVNASSYSTLGTPDSSCQS